MFYNIAGAVNALFVAMSLLGVLSQILKVWQRKSDISIKENTELLSLNQFTVSYFAYFVVFVYGYFIEPFNHYVVWSRLIACLLVLIILYEIWRDRDTRAALLAFAIALLALLIGLAGLYWGAQIPDEGLYISSAMIVLISIFIAQGGLHQIKLIIQSGSTGAVDLRMQYFVLALHMSTIVFAFAMGLTNGWPLLCLAVTGALIRLVMIYLFRWVRVSASAQYRRALYEAS